MTKFICGIINVLIGFAILLGIPYFLNEWVFLCISWIPALLVLAYLGDIISEMEN